MNNYMLEQDDLFLPRCEPTDVRCIYCEQYFEPVKSDAESFERFCSKTCERQSADVERVR